MYNTKNKKRKKAIAPKDSLIKNAYIQFCKLY